MSSTSALLLLPGLLCDDAAWAGIRPALGGIESVVATYGMLDSIPAMARHALTLAPPGPLAIAGHSMGGRVALEIVRAAPHRVERLALLDTGLDPLPTGEAGRVERAQRMALLDRARREGMRAMGREWARGMVHSMRVDSPLFESILAMIERKSADVFEAQIRALIDRPDARPLLPRIACPTTILCGRQDSWSPLARHVEMQMLIPGADLAVIEDCGHMSTMEQPAAVAGSLRTWLAQEATSS